MRGRLRIDEAAAGWQRGLWRSVLLGVAITAAAVLFRLLLPAATAGEQAIFSFPAIVVATLLFGSRAGAAAAVCCFFLLWYYVIPTRHSFHVASIAGGITLVIYALVGAALVWAISAMRNALTYVRLVNSRLEQLVEQRTAERNRVWERTRELVATIDEDNRIVQLNPALRELANTTERASFADLLVEEDRDAFRHARDLPDALFEARLATPDGVAWIAWSLVRDDGRRHLVGRDFTVEHECGELLQQSQKMELVGQMAGGLAHDFGNLLTPIGMSLDLLERRHEGDGRTRTLIGTAREGVARADELIRRLLALARPGRLDPAVRRLGPMLEEMTPLLRQAVDGRRLDVRIPDGLPSIRVDVSQLDMALLNLIVNARDATPPGGLIELSATVSDGEVGITVADDGHGMDAATRARAAEPFFTTKRLGAGSGLGLPMVNNFAAAAGGRLAIASDVGAGTRVTITLPVIHGNA